MSEIIELGIKVQTKDLKEAENQFDKTGNAADRTSNSFDRTTKASDRMNKELNGMVSGLKRLLAAYISFEAIRRSISFIVQFNDEVAKLKGQLVVVTGSIHGAAQAFEALNKWSDKTPFEIEDVVASFTRLRLAGIKPTEDMMNDLGNIAATLRRPLNEVVNSVAAATMGNARGLRQMGIQVEEYNNKLIATFGGQSRVIKNNAKAIVDYIQEISKANFKGGMEAQLMTLTGQLKLLHDQFENFAQIVGASGLNDALSEFVAYLNEGAASAGTLAEHIGKGLASAIRATIAVLRFFRENMEAIKVLIAALVAYKLALWVLAVASAFTQLNKIMKANIFGIAIAGVAGIISYFGGLKKVILDLTALWVTFVAEIQKAGNKLTAIKFNPKTGQLNRVDSSKENGRIDDELNEKLMDLQRQWNDAGKTDKPKTLDEVNKELGIDRLAGSDTSTQDLNALKTGEARNKLIDQYLDKLRNEVELTTKTTDERERLQAIFEIENALKEQGMVLDEKTRATVEDLVNKRQELNKAMSSVVDLTNKMGETVKNTFKTLFKDGVGGMEDMLDSWSDMFYDWAADTIESQFFKPLFDSLASGLGNALQTTGGGGGSGGGILDAVGSLFGFADGGDFTVGGVGGVDSKTVMFRATPGEKVSVGNRAGGGGAPVLVSINVQNNGNNTQASVQQRETPDGKSIDVIIDEIGAKNVRKFGSQTNRAIRETFGVNSPVVTR